MPEDSTYVWAYQFQVILGLPDRLPGCPSKLERGNMFFNPISSTNMGYIRPLLIVHSPQKLEILNIKAVIKAIPLETIFRNFTHIIILTLPSHYRRKNFIPLLLYFFNYVYGHNFSLIAS